MTLIKRLIELEAKATPGPWCWSRPEDKEAANIECKDAEGYYDGYVIQRDSGVYGPDVPTGDMIIEVRNVLRELLAVVAAAIEDVDLGRASSALCEAVEQLEGMDEPFGNEV